MGAGTRDVWKYTPELPIRTAPYFAWPIKPLYSLVYLLKSWNPIGWRFLMLLGAIVTWNFFTPDLTRTSELSVDWIAEIWLRNLVILVVIAGGLHLWLHVLRGQGDTWRYDMRPMNANAHGFTFRNQVRDNMFWSFVALQWWTFWECLMYWAWSNGWATRITFESSPVWFVVLIVLLPIWAGFYFYWQHRLLHARAIFRYVHARHHKNINTGPWSGLAMHPIESFVLMSDILIFFLIPAHPIHAIFLLFHHGVGAPTSHAGFEYVGRGRVRLPVGDFFHQLHHKFFDCNYGTWETPWDQWFDTFHDGTAESDAHMRERRKNLMGRNARTESAG